MPLTLYSEAALVLPFPGVQLISNARKEIAAWQCPSNRFRIWLLYTGMHHVLLDDVKVGSKRMLILGT